MMSDDHSINHCFTRIFFSAPERQYAPCGAGVALRDGFILTCAHVVAEALKLEGDYKNPPDQEIYLDFPFLKSKKLTAKVVFWDPTPENDIAGLKLNGPFPENVIPISLATAGDWGDVIHAFGYSGNANKKELVGAWTESNLQGTVDNDWVELIGGLDGNNFIQKGFSGGPVWNDTQQCFIGIIVAVDSSLTKRVAYFLPTPKIVDCWKELQIEGPAKKINRNKTLPPLTTILSRINRQQQAYAIKNFFTHYNSKFPRPALTIIHGNDEQGHDLFFTHLVNEIIPKMPFVGKAANLPAPRIYLIPPVGFREIQDLEPNLMQALADVVLGNPSATREDVQKSMDGLRCPSIVRIHLNTEDWQHTSQGLLEAYVDFWRKWPEMRSGQVLLIFLFISHTTPKAHPLVQWLSRSHNSYKIKICDQIKTCDQESYDRIVVKEIPELTNVSKAEVEHWARQEVSPYCEGDLGKIMADIRHLYQYTREYSMDFLVNHFREFLINHTKLKEVQE